MNETNNKFYDNIDEFENELRELLPWTPPVVVLRARAAKTWQPWRWAVAGLLIGVTLGAVCTSRLVEPRTVEVVRYVEIPVSEQSITPPVSVLETNLMSERPDVDRELDALIGSYNDRAKILARIAESSSSAGTERFGMSKLPDDPNSVFRLRESLKM